MEQQFFLHLSSEDSKEIHPKNSASSFVVQLPETKYLEGQWMCALCQVQLNYEASGAHKNIYICSDLCEGTIVGTRKFSLLRQVTLKGRKSSNPVLKEFFNLFYIKVKKEEFSSVAIHIKDRTGSDVSFLTGELNCVLHFKKYLGFF